MKVKKYMEATPTKEECGAIRLVLLKKQIAKKSSETKNFPEGIDSGAITAFYQAAMNNIAEAQHAEDEWWKQVVERYKLPTNISFDPTLGKFYQEIDTPD